MPDEFHPFDTSGMEGGTDAIFFLQGTILYLGILCLIIRYSCVNCLISTLVDQMGLNPFLNLV